MRSKSYLSNLGLLLVVCVAMAIVTGVRVRTQSPFVVFGSNSGVAQPIKSTSNALWVSLQGAAASITTPVVVGGTGTTSTLTLLPTSGNGTTGSNVIIGAGNNGSIEAMRVLDTGFATFPGNGTSGLTNFERFTIKFASSSFQLITEHGGSGAARPMAIASEGDLVLRANGVAANGWRITSSATIGSLITDSDNSYDIGATNATRPRALFLGQPAITPGSGTGITLNDSGSVRTLVYKITLGTTAFVCNATTCDATVATLPAKTFVQHAMVDVSTAFTCSAVCTTSTLSATLGKTAGGNEYLLSFDIDAAVARFGTTAAQLGASLTEATIPTAIGDLASWTATTAIVLRMTSGTGNIGNGAATNLGVGSMTVYLTTIVMP